MALDAVIVGGGLMGSVTAWNLAKGGMTVAVVERAGFGQGASGVNAGTLSIQIKRAALIPYALKGWELWRSTAERFGIDIGFAQKGGLTLALNDDEADLLASRMAARKEAGCPIEFVRGEELRVLEPNLTDAVRLASFCPLDASANSAVTGRVYRQALKDSGVEVRDNFEVVDIARSGGRFTVLARDGRRVSGKRIVLAAGAWLRPLAAMLGVDLPIGFRVNMVSVTERAPKVVGRIIGVATGLLTLKQSANGTVLIGGGWQGRGSAERGGYEIIPDNLVGNLRLASFAVPALADVRVVRTWLGCEAHAPDLMPLAGDLPGVEDAFIIGCVRGGYTISPFIGLLMAQHILGREPEMPIFDPARPMAVEPGSQADPSGGFLHVDPVPARA